MDGGYCRVTNVVARIKDPLQIEKIGVDDRGHATIGSEALGHWRIEPKPAICTWSHEVVFRDQKTQIRYKLGQDLFIMPV
jgi:hypothetical protein